ncbi:MAG: two-component system response regulator [Pseudomonadales bacterium]|jgi:putative two-component system response regulator|uniref:Two-component system response regulator n=1 Tax=Halopseudomonas aestusnigri TaxID=857252 RepID=A0AAQ1G7X8_9GAMM|nr:MULTISPECIES: two-component system response regulator [Halopseudomonas]MAH01461.1 two-component system response regulator [Pseudomonadales bacterium]MEE2798858.1 two-component system response regulator [Pseudomonadota bacterium]HBT58857.1 HD domain-containing protein [Pseudomonas sp.]MAP78113.1 two-component system response regulator [Pseudomonadales bacterium]MAS66863.1 two-component system response regulator [Pseudomonadales bacterium]|tara:strand:- start:10493 stop:11482 length:990 start_codon:yes stop_codon:yes gene_type:complete
MPFKDKRPALLLVDDEPANLHVLKHILQDDYRLLFARDGQRALELAAAERPQLILLDVMMPGMTGHEVCAQLKSDPHTSDIPVIFVTALSSVEDEIRGFELGAVDYISKPVSAPIVKARVRTHLSLVRAEVLRQTRLNIVQALGMAAEYKDNETGLHVIRMSHFSRIIALEAGFSPDEAEELLHAAPMHDVGKIGIPDAILQKPGKLDENEWLIMQKHPEIGAQIIGEHNASMLQMARRIALGHHEKWDGSGYPAGLAGDDIPIEARIVAIADVFDALTSVRPYKKAWTVEDAVALIREQSGRHFDPQLVECFIRRLDEINQIRERWAE